MSNASGSAITYSLLKEKTMNTLVRYNTGNIEKFLNDIEKHFIGGDEWMHRFGSPHESSENYPPYNLVKESNVDFRLEIALAGYKREDIEVTTEWNKLFVEVKKVDDSADEYVHHGTQEELWEDCGFDAKAIVKAVEKMLSIKVVEKKSTKEAV